MKVIIKKTKLKNVSVIKPYKFQDFRGSFIETYNLLFFNKKVRKIKFVQDDISISKKNVLRGIHGDNRTWKLVSCLLGKIYLIVVNNDKKSKDYRKWISLTLSDRNNLQVLIPPKYGNAYLALSKKVIYSYKQSTYYNRKSQFTINWKDPKFKFKWPIKKPILSFRDKFI